MYIQTLIAHFDLMLPGFLGLLFSVVYKFLRISQRAQTANEKKSFKQYLSEDWASIALSFITLFICLVIIPDAINYYPKINLFLGVVFVLAGFGGANTMAAILSRADKKVMKIIDQKTDVADGKDPK